MIDSPVHGDSKNSPPFGLQLEINKPIDNTLFMRDDELSIRLHLLPLAPKLKRKMQLSIIHFHFFVQYPSNIYSCVDLVYLTNIFKCSSP